MAERTTEPGWRPLIVDADRRAAIETVIKDTVAAIDVWRAEHGNDHSDDADYATLRIYVASDELIPDPDDAAGAALAQSITTVAERHEPGLYGGAARIAFAVGHLSAGDDADTACEMIERSLYKYLATPNDNYDLISGHVGLAVPVLQRIADGNPSETSEPLARRILDQLERGAREVAGGLAWHTPPELLPAWQRELAPDGYFNLGLAHGMPGVAAILARYIAAGVEVERARRLLDGLMTYLRAVRSSTFGNRYPAWFTQAAPPDEPHPTRVAWCYGDLGVAVGLLSAALATGRDDWRADALDLAHGMAERADDVSGAIDAGLCHGAAGNAHLFNRLWQASGDDRLRTAALHWFDRALAMRRSDAIAGWPRGAPKDGVVHWEPAPDLLTGAPGIALALHAAISPIEPAWDQVLLSDLSPALSPE
ncbi:MAG TPA: lanthionine synthetase C family protein [Kofleriaceae bacterium]|nr:lanthionine synthetase C family protein [Kofleriaceae bacterium]